MELRNVRRTAARWVNVGLLCITSAPAWAIDWPQEINAEEGTIVVYQPQPESLDGNLLKGRAAMSLQLEGHDEPVFGAFWFDARIDTDRDAGTALIRDVKVTHVRWPDSKDAGQQRFTAIVEGAVPENGFEISLEQLTASLESAETEKKSLEDLRNDPPVIVFERELAVLLLYDGDPRYSPVENSDYERILNTPFAVVRDKRGEDYWLSSGTFWYHAKDALGPWSPTASPPSDLVKMMPAPDEDEGAPSSPPAIVAANKPTELIVTQGKPDWQSLPGGELLYVKNTETPWLRELSTSNMYVLLSGRWYRSKSEQGPWTFVRADELPAGFKDIPPDSDVGGVRTAVAGTDEAKEATLDAQVPQTAAIKRSEAKLTVEYDGEPKFEKIPGTSVSYAVNTGAQVLEVGGKYYAVDNGVWFVSSSAKGPWAVADSVPEEEIGKIPPNSPVYNTTYVHVYESTPQVVYVGYTPGYLWSFPYYGVPVYGTGWYYPPYYGAMYYPRPPTWGFHVGYNPWTGWNFGVSWSNGFFSFGVGWSAGYPGAYRPWGCCGGWYGGGYRRPVVINTGNINIGNNINVGNRTTVRNNIEHNPNINIDNSKHNLYNRPENRTRNADPAVARTNLKQARPAANRPNNVYADRNGNVARQVNDQWQARDAGGWNTNRSRPSTGMDRSNFDRSGLDRASHARQVGASRQMSRPGNMRSGGFRRR